MSQPAPERRLFPRPSLDEHLADPDVAERRAFQLATDLQRLVAQRREDLLRLRQVLGRPDGG